MKNKIQDPTLAISNLLAGRGAFRLRIAKLAVMPGRVVCVAGANGCGKTTLLEVVVGLLQAREGMVAVAGRQSAMFENHPYFKRAIGFIPDDEDWIIPELTAHEYVLLLAEIYRKAGVEHDPVHDARAIARTLQFTQFDQQLGSLSHGNKKKVQLIAGLMHRPQLVVIDELRNGLDPIAIKQAEILLAEQRKLGTAILAATHDLWWAERFADDIVMIQNGRVVLQEATHRIVSQAGSVEAKFMELYTA